MVEDSPTFIDVWPEIEERCRDCMIIAHNAAFDMSILTACIDNVRLSRLLGKFICTVSLSRSLLPGAPNHKLQTMATIFGIPLEHHNAASDAIVCAELGIRLFRLLGSDGIEHYSRHIVDFGHHTERSYSSAVSKITFDELDIKHIPQDARVDMVTIASPDSRFVELHFVFTGELIFLTRENACKIVERQGGIVSSSVSRKTDIVVVGDEVLEAYHQSGKATGKLTKALQLVESGVNIKIINETEFLELVS